MTTIVCWIEICANYVYDAGTGRVFPGSFFDTEEDWSVKCEGKTWFLMPHVLMRIATRKQFDGTEEPLFKL